MGSVSTQASVSTDHGATTVEPSLAATLRAFEEAFNRQDAEEVAAYWDPEGAPPQPPLPAPAWPSGA